MMATLSSGARKTLKPPPQRPSEIKTPLGRYTPYFPRSDLDWSSPWEFQAYWGSTLKLEKHADPATSHPSSLSQRAVIWLQLLQRR